MYENDETLGIIENVISEAHDFIFELNNIEKLGYAKNDIIEVIHSIEDEHCKNDLSIVCGIIGDVQKEMIHS